VPVIDSIGEPEEADGRDQEEPDLILGDRREAETARRADQTHRLAAFPLGSAPPEQDARHQEGERGHLAEHLATEIEEGDAG
jgi:hypothetical protein